MASALLSVKSFLSTLNNRVSINNEFVSRENDKGKIQRSVKIERSRCSDI